MFHVEQFMTRAEKSLMKELEHELNRGCSVGFRLPESERERLSNLYPKIRTVTAAENEFFNRMSRYDYKKFRARKKQ